MKVIDHTKFAMCEYNQKVCNNPFELGSIVIHKNTKEIGVVIQIHNEYELRVDAFGNATTDKLRLATVQEINSLGADKRNIRSHIIDSIDLFGALDLLPVAVLEVLDKYSDWEQTYETCRAMLDELAPLGYTFEYYLDAMPYELRKIGTKHFEFNSK